MTPRSRLPYALRTGSFRVRTALHRGVSSSRLRAKDLVTAFHGTRSHTVPTTVEERAQAVAPRLRRDEVFSHVTAAAVIGLPLPRRFDRAPIHVTTIGKDQALRVRGTVGHRSRAGRVSVVHARGVPLTHPADVFVMLGPVLSVDELVVVGEALVSWLPWCTPADLVAAVRRHRGARGLRKVRAALAEIRVGARSPGETRARLALTRRGLPEPSLNFTVTDPDGRFVACVDLAYPEHRIAIEYESDLHRTDRRTFFKDLTRGEALKDAGWWLVRAISSDVGRDADRFAARVHRVLTATDVSPHDPRGQPAGGSHGSSRTRDKHLVDASTKSRQDGLQS